MTFAHPKMLWLLPVIVPGLLLFFWWSGRARRKLMAQFIQARLLPGLISGVSVARQKISAAILIAAAVCLVVTLARPQWGYDLEEVTQRGLDIVVAIDTSKSMLAADIAPNRLTRAKLAALDLMRQAKADRLGLVAFAGTAFLECPLTIDDAAFRQSVEALDVNTLPEGGTAIAAAIQTALKAFKEEDSYKVLVLFTDGEDHDSGALEAAQQAAKAGLRIFTIGIGSADGEILYYRGDDGQTNYVRDQAGNVVKSRLDESLLHDIAEATPGGLYLPLRGANTIDVLYQRRLAPLPKSESKEKWAKRPIERYHWPLSLAIALLALEMFFPERKREPARSAATARAAAPLAQAALLALLLLPAAAYGSPATALRAYQSGKYQQALAEYERLIEKTIGKEHKPEALEELLKQNEGNKSPAADAQLKEFLEKAVAGTGKLNFNAGASAYKAGDMDVAAKHFTLATADPDWKLQEKAYYNLGNSLYQIGDQTPDPEEKQARWQKAIDSYRSALGLDARDADAAHNRQFVEKRLEELKKQQQQQNEQQKQQQSKNDQKQQDQDKQNDQSKNDQQKSDSQKQDKKPDQPQQQAKNDKSPEPQNDQQPKPEQPEDKKDQPSKDQDTGKNSSNQDQNSDSQAQPPNGQMTPQQAARLLDAQKNDEKLLPIGPEGKAAISQQRPIKDW